MSWLLAFGPQILGHTSRVLLWVPRRLRLVKQEKKEAEQEGILWLQRYRQSLEEHVNKETDRERRQALEEELDRAVAAERGYYRRMAEVTLERAGRPAYDALVSNGKQVLEPENKAKLTEAVTRLELLPPPQNAAHFMSSATAKYALERYDEALADLNKALELRPDYPEALTNRGVTYDQLKQHHEALADYTRALGLRPHYPEALNNRGVTYCRLNRYDEALADYTRALELRADFPGALVNRGNTYNDLKRYEEALGDYNRALELTPDDPEILNNRGAPYIKLERYQEALADFNKTLELEQDRPGTTYNIACLFSLWGKPDDAILNLEKAIALDEKYRQMAAKDSDFDNIRDDPRFRRLVEGE